MRKPFLFAAALALLLVASHRADAMQDEQAVPAVADQVLAVTKTSRAVFTLRDGRELTGTAIAYDAQALTLLEDVTRRVLAIPRDDVVGVRLAVLASAYPPIPIVPEPRPKPRHVGIQLFQGPGNLMIDVDYGHFYGFVGASLGYPIIFDDPRYASFVLGGGGTWKLSPTSRWQFDFGGSITPTWWGGFSAGIGIYAGFHYTSASGFTVGFKIPVFGVAPGCSDLFGSSGSSGCDQVKNGAALIGNYYLQAGMSLPIVSLGYRF